MINARIPLGLLLVVLVAASAAHAQMGRKSNICGSWNNYCQGGSTGGGPGREWTTRPEPSQSAEDIARTVAREGDRLLGINDWAGAEREYRKAIGISASYGYAWSKLGETLEKQGQYAAALDAYRRAAELGREVAAGNHKRLSDWLRAQNTAREAARNQDEYRQRTFDEAREAEKKPDGNAAAAQRWREYLKRYPNDAYALGALGRYLYLDLIVSQEKPGQIVNEAVNAVTRAIQLDPANGYYPMRMMLILALVGRADEAVAYADEAARKFTDREALVHHFYYMIDNALKHASHGAAERMIEIGARIFPANVTQARYGELRVAQYNAAVKSDNRDAAVASARALTELYPQRHDHHALLGNALFRNNREDEARRAYARAIDLAPAANKADVLFRYGRELAFSGDWPAYLEVAKLRLTLIPATEPDRRAAAESNLGYALYKLGHKAAGLSAMEGGIAKVAGKADFPEWLVTHGNNLASLGEYQRAVAVFERALQLQPDNKMAIAKLAETRPKVAQTPTSQLSGPFSSGATSRQPGVAETPSIADPAGGKGGAFGQAGGAALTGRQGAAVAGADAAGAAAVARRVFDTGDLRTAAAGPSVVLGGMQTPRSSVELPESVRSDPRWRALEHMAEAHRAEKVIAERNISRINERMEKGEGDRRQLQVELVQARDAVTKAEAGLNVVMVRQKQLVSFLVPDFVEDTPATTPTPAQVQSSPQE
jgi:tetratricopeptide (TPR) repeat protein